MFFCFVIWIGLKSFRKRKNLKINHKYKYIYKYFTEEKFNVRQEFNDDLLLRNTSVVL
jgi:hypothetical protein